MHSSTLINTLAFFAATGLAGYVLEDDYFQEGFLDQFTFADGMAENDGFALYKDVADADAQGLVKVNGSSAYLGVDSTNVTPNGRPSIRLTSKKSYQYGLFVADIAHMPGGICGTWPAFWMVGPNWPTGGEIDIVEGVNEQTSNDITLHTRPSTTIVDNGQYTGSITNSYCGPNSANSGCQIAADDNQSYGTGFNAAGGGIYAVEWTSSVINIYFFSHAQGSIPEDILGDSPSPSTWGKPVASFSGDFDMAETFVNQQIVINTNLCGSWAGGGAYDSCASSTGQTCTNFVANNPSAFSEAYWEFNALKIYLDNGNDLSSSSSPSVAAPSSTSSVAPAVSTPAHSSTAAPQVSSAPASSATPSSTPTTQAIPAPHSAPPSSEAPAPPAPTSIPAPPAFPPAVSAPFDAGLPPTHPLSTFAVTQTSTNFITVTSSAAAVQSSSSTEFAPFIGSNGIVDQDAEVQEAPLADEGMWSTAPDGDAEYENKRRETARHARHLAVHRRRAGRL